LRKVGDRIAAAIEDVDVEHHELGARSEDLRLLRRLLGRRLLLRPTQERKGGGYHRNQQNVRPWPLHSLHSVAVRLEGTEDEGRRASFIPYGSLRYD